MHTHASHHAHDEIPAGTFDDRDLLDPTVQLQAWENELRTREAHLREQEHLAAQRTQRLTTREREVATREGMLKESTREPRLTGYLAHRFLKLA